MQICTRLQLQCHAHCSLGAVHPVSRSVHDVGYLPLSVSFRPNCRDTYEQIYVDNAYSLTVQRRYIAFNRLWLVTSFCQAVQLA